MSTNRYAARSFTAGTPDDLAALMDDFAREASRHAAIVVAEEHWRDPESSGYTGESVVRGLPGDLADLGFPERHTVAAHPAQA